MTLLLDTHLLLWSITASSAMSRRGAEGRDRFDGQFNYLDHIALDQCYRSGAGRTSLSFEEGLGGGHDGVQGPWVKALAQR